MRPLISGLAASLLLSLPVLAQETDAPLDLPALADDIDRLLRDHVYDPEALSSPAYARVSEQVEHLAQTAESREAFVSGFHDIWHDGPFSHVQLSEASMPLEQMITYIDTMRVGGGGAVLSWRDDIAVLTVNTMMGQDTIEEIDAAYDTIAAHSARGLIIDLRENGGGAFAVKPLVEHVLTEPLDAGAFVSQPWNARMERAPRLDDVDGASPWEGWSVRSFWEHVQIAEITRIRFVPDEAQFDGPVYVLTSARTASAAEMAADAFKASGRAQLVGETTAGQMLSQTMYELPGDLHLALPIADYYSFANGRIEGAGVSPHIAVPADAALDTALAALARE